MLALTAALRELHESAPMLDRGRSRLDALVSPGAARCFGSAARIVADAVPSLQRDVQHAREARAPGAVHGVSEKRQSLTRWIDNGCDQPAVHGELLDQWRRGIGAGRSDADAVVGGVLGVAETAVAVNEDDVGVTGPFQVLAGERQRRGVDVD